MGGKELVSFSGILKLGNDWEKNASSTAQKAKLSGSGAERIMV